MDQICTLCLRGLVCNIVRDGDSCNVRLDCGNGCRFFLLYRNSYSLDISSILRGSLVIGLFTIL